MFPLGIGLRDPRSQKRDLGHPSISPFDIAEGTSFVMKGRRLNNQRLLANPQQNCHLDRSEAQWRDLRFCKRKPHSLGMGLSGFVDECGLGW